MAGDSERRALIAGGGIGGLAAALALGRSGRAVTVLERSGFADESGAGIQLGPNATRALEQLGVLDAIEQVAFKPEAIWIFDGLSGRRLATVPLGPAAEQRYGAPYLTLHRADLHARLLAACRDISSIALKSDFTLASAASVGGGIEARSEDGQIVEGPFLVGADGLWSRVRNLIDPGAEPRFAGATAWRTLIPRQPLPGAFAAPVVGLWLGPRAHLVHYPVRGGSDLNLVAVIEGGDARQGWNQEGDGSFLARFSHWCKDSKSLLESASAWRGWSLYRLARLRRWSLGNAVLLGDAAHPTLPYLAQGAALAIEDAMTLGDCLDQTADAAEAFHRYQALRQSRTRRVQRHAERLGRLYHLGGPLRLIRNTLLGRRTPHGLLASLDWLYRDQQ